MEVSRPRAPAPAPAPRAAAAVHASAGSLLAADVPRGPARRARARRPVALVPPQPLPSIAAPPTHRRSPRLARPHARAHSACDAHLSQTSRTASFPRGLCRRRGARLLQVRDTPAPDGLEGRVVPITRHLAAQAEFVKCFPLCHAWTKGENSLHMRYSVSLGRLSLSRHIRYPRLHPLRNSGRA